MALLANSGEVLVLACIFLCLLTTTTANRTATNQQEALARCQERTGLANKDIREIRERNMRCSLDCVTKQGHVMTEFTKDGTPCHEADWTCFMGSCMDKSNRPNTEEFMNIEITILEARVPDLDPNPGQGESDAFVSVVTGSESQPTYKKDEVMCYTHVIQDDANPDWQDFRCKPLPVIRSMQLKFMLFDSDKPVRPDFIGEAVQSVESLVNKGRVKLEVNRPGMPTGKYYVVVEVKGKEYASI